MLRKLAITSTCALLVLVATSCKKSTASNGDQDDINNQAIAKTFDDSEPAPAERKPISGVDLSELNPGALKRFETLVDKLASPCGKAHSLRTSKNTDASCLRAPFAVRYVAELLKDGLSDKEVTELYEGQYSSSAAVAQAFKLEGVPHTGPDDAPVVMVEFYDYGCPACKSFAPEVDKAVRAFSTEAVLYYKQFPLSAHPNSVYAAQAVLAAHAQGKFEAMHKLLFQNSPQHEPEKIKGYAVALGLNMNEFENAYAAAGARVTAEKNEGIAANVESTPTMYMNGRAYNGPGLDKYIRLFIEEALAERR